MSLSHDQLQHVRITNVLSVYKAVRFLYENGMLWHMDYLPEECFEEDEHELLYQLERIQLEMWKACDQEAICLHGVCCDVLKSCA